MRNAPGSGCYEILPSGRCRYILKVAGVVYRNTCADRETAEREVAAIHEMLAAGGQDTIGAVTLEQWGARWLSGRRNRNADDETRRWYRHIAGSALASMPVSEIARRDVRAWLQELGRRRALKTGAGGKRVPTRKPLSEKTQKHCLDLVRGALQAALDEELITTNPAADLRIAPQQRTEAHVREYLSPDELKHLFALALPLDVRAAYALACYGGARPGEMFALRRPDVCLDPERPHIVVRRSHGGTTKTDRVRVIPILEPARLALAAWLEASAMSRSELVFPSPRGGRYGKGYDWGWADRHNGAGKDKTPGWRTKAGIPAHKDFYSLRHTCATGLLQGWWTEEPWRLEEVRAVLGHTTTKTTEIYAQMTGSDLIQKVARKDREFHASSTPISGPEAVTDGRAWRDSNSRPTGSKPGSKSASGMELGALVELAWNSRGADLARRLLGEVAAGRTVSGQLLAELAGCVLEQRPIVLAQEILAGGPHRLRAAIELAALLLAAQAPETGAAEQAS